MIEFWHDDYKPKKLQAVVDKIERRVSDRLVEARAALAMPDSEVKEAQLTDAEVAAGIRYLTAQDADRASLANDRGWSPTVSGRGHWACAMLDTDPAAAIHVARQFIGGYVKQLRKGGVL